MQLLRTTALGMDTANLTEPMKSLQKQESKGRLDKLKLALSRMALCRGDVMDAGRLESYSKAIASSFSDDADAMVAMERLAKAERDEYEPKIPELATMLRAIRVVDWERKRILREAEEEARHENYLFDLKRNPHKFCSVASVWTELLGKQSEQSQDAEMKKGERRAA